MKKKVLRISLVLFAVLMLLSSVFAATNPYPYYDGVNCTYYVWQRVYDELGIALPSWGDAGDWALNAANDNYSVDYNATAGSIVVWPRHDWTDSYGNWYGRGHVAYVESVSNGQMTIAESNWEGKAFNRATLDVTVYRGYGASPKFIHLAPVDSEKPNITDYYIDMTNVTDSSFVVKVKATDNVGVTRMGCNVWTKNDQSDMYCKKDTTIQAMDIGFSKWINQKMEMQIQIFMFMLMYLMLQEMEIQ